MKKITILSLLLAVSLGALAYERSDKRGVSENDMTRIADIQAFAPGVSWYYNWGTAPIGDDQVGTADAGLTDYVGSDKEMQFVPMVWGMGTWYVWDNDLNQVKTVDGQRVRNEAVIENLRKYYEEHPADRYLLGFNEPNLTNNHGGADMTPEETAEAWRDIEEFARENNLILVAPALNYSPDVLHDGSYYATPDEWMDAFIAAYTAKYGTAPTYDYVALHSYMNDPGAVKGYCENFAQKYGKQVWLTEFCSWEQTFTASEQMSAMITKVKYLEQSDYVFRYAWFKGINENVFPYMGLIDTAKHGVLTDLGFAYVHMSRFDKEKFYTVGEKIPANQFVDASNIKAISRTEDPQAIDAVEVDMTGGGASATYQVNIPATGTYKLLVRASRTLANKAKFNVVNQNNQVIAKCELEPTGGDHSYTTQAFDITLPAGKQTLTIKKSNFYKFGFPFLKIVSSIDEEEADMQDYKSPNDDDEEEEGGEGQGDQGDYVPVTDNEVHITSIEEQPYHYADNEYYYIIYADNESRKGNLKNYQVIDIGPNGTSRHLYVWEESMTANNDQEGNNSMGTEGNYMSWTVGDKGWSGLSYTIDETDKLDLSGINSDYYFHFAVKSTSTESFDFQLSDGVNTAHLVLGQKAYNGTDPMGDIPRDGKWYSVEVPVNYLHEQFGLDYSTDNNYRGNVLALMAGGVQGTQVDYDAVFFHGAMNSKASGSYMPSEDEITVSDIPDPKNNPFIFYNAYRYYIVYLDEDTRARHIRSYNMRELGPDNVYRHLDLWKPDYNDNLTVTFSQDLGENSFGVAGNVNTQTGYTWTSYMNAVVGGEGWSGLGYRVEAGTGLNLSGINDEYFLHVALKTTYEKPIAMTIKDGYDTEATIVFGQERMGELEPSADFDRDGKWHNIDIPLKWLREQYGIDFTTTTNFAGNLIALNLGGDEGTEVGYDALFFYGPNDTRQLPLDDDPEADEREITVTKSTDVDYAFANDKYYPIYLDAITYAGKLQDQKMVVNCQPDGMGRNLYAWEGSFNGQPGTGANSLGVTDATNGSYMRWQVTDKGWSGLGYNINGGVDLSGILSSYTLHFAVRTTYTGPIQFYVTDGQGRPGYIVLGSEPMGELEPAADFPRDGEWYDIDVPVAYLMNTYGLDFRYDFDYSGNILCLLAGGVQGTQVDYDAVFFCGDKVYKQTSEPDPDPVPEPEPEPEPVTAVDKASTSTGAPIEVYTLNGVRVAKARTVGQASLPQGLYIVKQGGKTRKLHVK